MSLVQAWRGHRPAFLEPSRSAPIQRVRSTIGSRHLILAIVASTPLILVSIAVRMETPSVLQNLPAILILAWVALVAFIGLALRFVRRRATHEMRSLYRIARRIESGDFDRALPDFSESDMSRLAHTCSVIGSRMRAAEEELFDVRDQSRRDRRKQMATIEHVTSENAQLRAETSILHGFGDVLNKSLGPPQICSELIANIAGKIEYERAVVYLTDGKHGMLEPQVLCDAEHRIPLVGNFLKDLISGKELSIGVLAVQVVQRGVIVRIDDVEGDARCGDLSADCRSVLLAPLRGRSAVLGVVQIEHIHTNAYDESDERILASLALQAGIAVENIRLFEEAAKVQALRELDSMKSNLLSTVSHELKTPLSLIKGFSESLLRTDVKWSEAERIDFLQTIDDETDKLNELIEDLLEMTRIESGTLRVEPQPLRMQKLIQPIIKKVRGRALKHTFQVSIATDFPEVMADARRVDQIFRNLIENAVKYSEGGTITVRGDVVEGWAQFSVSDSGIGIPAQDIERVFDRFYRVDDAAVRRAGGTGLGLSICQGMIQMHGGRIWVESTIGEGSTFRFTLPIVRPQVASTSARQLQEVSS